MENNNTHEQLKWYMITTMVGKESLVVESLKNKISSDNLSGIISDFKIAFVPHMTPRGKLVWAKFISWLYFY